MNKAMGYAVQMQFFVVNAVSGEVHGTVERTYEVRPPVWTCDDEERLRMELEHLAKVECLLDIRRNLHHDDCYQSLRAVEGGFVVDGILLSWSSPVHHGERKKHVYTLPAANAPRGLKLQTTARVTEVITANVIPITGRKEPSLA